MDTLIVGVCDFIDLQRNGYSGGATSRLALGSVLGLRVHMDTKSSGYK
jgi:hypothetical protein